MAIDAAYLGVPRSFTFEGTTYEVGLITGKIKAEFERLFAARAHERLMKNKKAYSKKEYLAELRLLGEREDKGEFAFLGTAAMSTILTTSWGQKTLLTLLMPTCPKDVLERILDEQADDVNWVIQRVLQESMPTSMKMAEKEDPFALERPELNPTA